MKDTPWSAPRTTPSQYPMAGMLNVFVIAAVIGVIACLVVGSVNYARTATTRNHAILTMARMRDAWQGYKTKLTILPVTPPDESTALETKGPFLAALLGLDATVNPENIVFLDQSATLEPNERAAQNPQGEWELRDPWGHLFRLQVDLNEDGKIPNPARSAGPPEAKINPPAVVLYSAGPDGNFDTWQDNVRTW